MSSTVGGSANNGGSNSSGDAASGGTSDGSSAGKAGQQASTSLGYGQVVLAHQAAESGLVELRAAFHRGSVQECPIVASYGSCSLALCASTDASTPETPLAAGVVSAHSTEIGLQLVSAADPQAPGGYRDVQQSLVGDVKGGETLTLAAEGGEIPAFSRDLKMLGPLVLTKPTSASTTIPVSRGALTLEWQPGETGTEVIISAFGSGADWTTLKCVWDASAGVGSVPAEILTQLPNGKQLFVAARRQVTQDAGDFALSLSLLTSARTANDKRARALVLTDSL